VRLIGSPGQRNDIAFAHELIEGFKRNRTFKRPYDTELYKERNIIERFFNKLKQFRRVATRYDKLLANFMGFVKLAAIAIWLK
jgi:putative transposase